MWSQFSAFRPSVSQRCFQQGEGKRHIKKEKRSCFTVPVLQPTEALPLTSTRPALYHEISVGFQLCHKHTQLAGCASEQLSQPGSQNSIPELVAASPQSAALLWLCLLIYCSGRGILDINTYAAINWQGHKTLVNQLQNS